MFLRFRGFHTQYIFDVWKKMKKNNLDAFTSYAYQENPWIQVIPDAHVGFVIR